MENIFKAIFAAYNGNAALKAVLTGGLHFELANQASYPYAVYSGWSVIDHYLGNYFEMPNIQFDIYASTNATRLSCYENLTALFDDATPATTGYTAINMEREYVEFLREGEQNEIYRAIVQYRGMFRKG